MRNQYTKFTFFLIVIVLLTLSLLTYRNLSNYIDEVKWTRHSNLVLRTLELTISSIKDAETGHRGYQLTRDSSFLIPYNKSIKEIPILLKALDSLVSNDATQAKRVDSLKASIQNQFILIPQILTNARESALYMDTYENKLLYRSKTNMDATRSQTERIIAAELIIFKQRIAKENDFRTIAPIAILIYTLFAITAAVVLFFRTTDVLRKQEQAERELAQSNIALKGEVKVRELREKQLQQTVHELDEKEKKYSSLFERSIDPIFLARLDFELINLNESFLTFFGYVKEEEKDITIRQIFANEADYHYFLATLKEVEQIRDFEVQLINKAGLKRWCLLNCVFIPDQSPDFCCYQGIIHDITLRKHAERELVNAERISLTGKMARIVAHEVRNPLTNLNLALEQLKDEIPNDNKGVGFYTDIIQRNVNRIEHLIGEMLNSSKPKDLQLELTPVNDLTEETIALSLDRLNLKQVDLERKFSENLPRILVDKEKVKIALLNIVINAIEAMVEHQGKLTIATSRKDDIITISIADNGKGMSADELEKLYEPFFTAKTSGLGLGLTSTKNILSSHNAEIQVASELGKGTTFSVLFKLAE